MPTTRSRSDSAASARDEGDSAEELNATVCESTATKSMENKLAAMMDEIKALRAEVAKYSQGAQEKPTQLHEDAVRRSSVNNRDEEAGNAITAAVENLNRTLSSTRTEHVRKLYDLPDFDGQPEDWPMFKEAFEMTTEEYGYSDRQNMLRLQKAIKGRAREVVECLLIHSSNVSKVVDTLRTRFGRPEQLVKSQIAKVRNFPQIPEDKLELLESFATKVQNLTSFLEAADCSHHLCNPALMDELLMKLPVQRRLDWARRAVKLGSRATVIHFSEWLQELSSMVSVACVGSNDQRRESRNKDERRAKFFLANDVTEQSTSDKCRVCSGGHKVKNCMRFINMSSKERWSIVRQRRLCFNCLESGHRTESCKQRHECYVEGCTKRVHKLLHKQDSINNNGSLQEKEIHAQQAFSGTTLQPFKEKPLFKILPVKLYANEREVDCFAFLDEGSAITLMNQSLADKLELSGPKENLTLQWFGNNTVTETTSRHDLKISGVKNNCKVYDLKGVRIVRNLQLPTQTIDLADLHYKYRHIKKIPLSSFNAATPDLLIGLDNVHLSVSRRTIASGFKGPAVVLTKLGWVVYGSDEGDSGAKRHGVYFTQADTSEGLMSLEQQVKRLVDDDLGVRQAAPAEAAEVTRANRLLKQTTVRKGMKFETGFLWKYDDLVMPASRDMAMKRFLGLEAKFQREVDFAQQYTLIMENYEKKGYSRKLSAAERAITTPRTWYLSHFGIYNPNKPDKLRLVFDAAAKVNGVSLNSTLLCGPDQGQPLITILLKFRQRIVGVCADIVEMFHQVEIREEDRASQRFLWRTNQKEPIEEYEMRVMTFGATCSPCSAQYVKNSNALEFREMLPDAVDAIVNNHYVDDFVQSFDEEQEAMRITEEVIWIHKQGGFELKRFVSNSELINCKLNKEKSETAVFNLERGDDVHFQKVLGMHWDTQKDALKFVLSFGRVDPAIMKEERRVKKREVLRLTMSVFDPFGIAAEYVLLGKLLLQSIWRKGTEWDEIIAEEDHEVWKQWLRILKEITDISVPRCYGAEFAKSPLELHVFSDASESAYAAVAYWRVPDGDKMQLAFVCGKSKCSPMKLTSIPRLELQSAVLATRLRQLILNSHNFQPTRIFMWSDSKTVIAWIRSDHRRYKPYVGHRINEILDGSNMLEWRWLPSALNPADFGTRRKDPKRQSFWITGPRFLLMPEEQWPQEEPLLNTSEELRVKYTCLFVKTDRNFYERFSSFLKLTRVVAWIGRFYENCRRKIEERQHGCLRVPEIERAELMICRSIQMSVYAEEYESLKKNKQVDRSSKLWSLTPYLDHQGVIRVSGRIDGAIALPQYTRRPIIMPPKNHITNLIIDFYHSLWRHQNQDTILAEVRRKYWIPHLRAEVRRATGRCQKCKNTQASPVNPQMGQLPRDRTTPFVRPFSYVGLDYMGPFQVVVGRRTEKRWIALFTCLTIRAIHLEVARDLTTDTCLMCIRNFINRRGTPIRIRSDNATNFIGAARELERQLSDWKNNKIANALVNRKVEWFFNCPLNPSAGGCWERLVRSVKRAMGHALYDENLQEHALYSLMCEAENIVNSRPLTHIPLDTPTNEPLTPNHFLIGTANSEQTPHPDEERLRVTRKQWRKVQQAQQSFWKRWLSEYLPDLCRRTKWYRAEKPLSQDDIVLICDSSIHRSKWQMGRVIKAIPGKDGQVRTAEVQTGTGILRRPACLLAKLDVGES